MFAIVNFAARKGYSALPTSPSPSGDAAVSAKNHARQTGRARRNLRLLRSRRRGSILMARRFTSPGIQRAVDMAG